VLVCVWVAPVCVCIGVGLEPSVFWLCVEGPEVEWLNQLVCGSAKTKLGV